MVSQNRFRISICGLIIYLLSVALAANAQEFACANVIGDAALEEQVRMLAKESRLIVVLRHAEANIAIKRCDCDDNTRGLSEPLGGERQADDLGRLLRWLGVTDARVEASRSCRTVQTAERLSLGAVNISDEIYEKTCDTRVNGHPQIRNRTTEVSRGNRNSVLVTHSGCMRIALNTSVDLSRSSHNGILAFLSKADPSVAIGCAWPRDWAAIEQRLKRGVEASPNPIGRADGGRRRSPPSPFGGEDI